MHIHFGWGRFSFKAEVIKRVFIDIQQPSVLEAEIQFCWVLGKNFFIEIAGSIN